jgi:hypothetical protein
MIFYGYNSKPAKSEKGRQSEIPNQTAHLQKSKEFSSRASTNL